ncbi:pyridoxal phosphate-dependent aminotransferase [Altericroceibacterium endophyticum]|uniref:Aminotransferase class I/II-fold pyridoxal phosphate-dependent enzyme n=1 Tax=Altericroceibacterium endophyticum TaxID=1808508 RepID=A0A6I4T7U2_9SPHN|nr:pyridoxal phosphate-dependent aminotransferase [Altericroceibacterium endophyticum]MXO66171.1 aminotransferase class I/II-fold pyridoxal phosphate-dependent enzyme [Altericroceibacterium endophyticum]
MTSGHSNQTKALGSYAQWIRTVIRRVRSDGNLLVSLFESSIPEPVTMVQELVAEGFGGDLTSRYTSAFASGNPYVVDHLAKSYDVTADQILCTTGATGALSLIYRALCSPGDHVLIENPCFDIFHALAGVESLHVDRFERCGTDFHIDPQEIERRIHPKTKLIVLSNLHNPSGMEVTNEVLKDIADIAERHGILVVVDEVYGPYSSHSIGAMAGMRVSPRIISINSLTKIFGLSTLRCGWIVANADVLAPIRALNDEVEFGISNLAHAMAALVLDHQDRFMAYTTDILAHARPIFDSYWDFWLKEGLVLGKPPEYGCIAFPRLAGIEDTLGFSEWLANRGSVVVAPGEYFGRAGHVRLGIGLAPAKLDYGLQTFTDGLLNWRDDNAASPRKSQHLASNQS